MSDLTGGGLSRFRARGAVFILLSFALSCAKSVGPPGGPVDKTPPEVVSVSPASGSVNVPLDAHILIAFSEGIDRRTVEKAVFISPQLDPPPEIKAKKDAFLIVPRDSLRLNTTYIVTLGTDLKDAHNMPLAQSATFAFSTGVSIDSGRIKGTIYKDNKGMPGISVALFTVRPDLADRPIDSLIPDYFTQTGEGGSFAFDFLPPDTFYLVAFEDKNKDHLINYGREMLALPFSQTILTAEQPVFSGIDARLRAVDTSTLNLRSVALNPDGLLKVRLTKPLEPPAAHDLFAAAILENGQDTTQNSAIIDYTPLSAYPASDFLLLVPPLTADQKYRLLLDRSPLYPDIADSMRVLTYEFQAVPAQDRVPPTLLEIVPPDKAANVSPDSTFFLRFSEPIDSLGLAGSVWLITADNETVAISFKGRNHFMFEGKPAEGLVYGRQFRWRLDASRIADHAGNRLGDSALSWTFSTVGKDTLGSVSGEINLTHPNDTTSPVLVSFRSVQGGAATELRLEPGRFQFRADLLPGYYTLSAFLDRNDNGIYDYGSISPYELAESFTFGSDTVRVRTRFESTGIILDL